MEARPPAARVLSSGAALDPLGLTARQGRFILLFILLFFLGWDLRAVLTDRGTPPTDTTTVEALRLEDLLQSVGGLRGFKKWLWPMTKGPLASPLVILLHQLVGDPVLAARLLSVAAHPLALWLACTMLVQQTSSWTAGLAACVLAGIFPASYGWFRLEFHEPLMALISLYILSLLLRPPDRLTHALKLGVALGLGTLTKVGFGLYLLAPGLWYLVSKVRCLRGLMHMAVAAALLLGLTLWWIVPNWETFLCYLHGSSQIKGQQLSKLATYLATLEGLTTYLGAALVGSFLSWRLRRASAHAVLILFLATFGGLAAVVISIDVWSRYLVPLLLPAGILVGLGAHGVLVLLARFKGRGAARLLAGGALLVSTTIYVQDNLFGLSGWKGRREEGSGMVTPDPRPHQAYPAIVALANHQGLRLLPLLDWKGMDMDLDNSTDLQMVWKSRGYMYRTYVGSELFRAIQQRRPIHLLLAHRGSDVLNTLTEAIRNSFYTPWVIHELETRTSEVLATYLDPSGEGFSIIRLEP